MVAEKKTRRMAKANEDEKGIAEKKTRERYGGILFFAPIYLGTIRFALIYISLTFLPLFTLSIDDLPF
jgi:hypothetical protein